VLLLTTTGAKSGNRHTTPVMYKQGEGTLHVFASKAGAPTNPDWYHNLVANPTVTVEVGTDSFEATAALLPREERDRVYAEQSALYPGFAEYQEKTTRVIPVVALTKAG
jgi:deazaflavin-dependent oxidoreductase (nitroreductase family)